MAQSTAYKTYDAVENREDLIDAITIVARTEAPFYERFGKTKVTNTYHEWHTDTLDTPAENTNIEGSDYSFSLESSPTRDGNYTQILDKDVKVSRTQILSDPAGPKSWDRIKAKKLKSLLRDVEYALVNGTGNSGGSGTARELKGVLSYITTNVETGTGTADQLTESMLNDGLQAVWDTGGNVNTIYANSYQKRKISGFSTSIRQMKSREDYLNSTVSTYESDFGTHEIVLDPRMTSTVVALLDNEMWKVGELDPIHFSDVPDVGRYKRGVWECELTLESLNESGSGKITNLASSSS